MKQDCISFTGVVIGATGRWGDQLGSFFNDLLPTFHRRRYYCDDPLFSSTEGCGRDALNKTVVPDSSMLWRAQGRV